MTSTPLERPAEFGDREFLTDEEVAVRANLDARLAQGATEEELAGVVRPRDLQRVTGYDRNIVGQEYNRFWTDTGPRRQRETWRRTSLVIDPPDGQIPPFTRELLQRWERREEAARGRGQRDDWLDANLGERCLSSARSRLGGSKLILQAPGYVVVRVNTLNQNDVYVVPLDGRPPPPSHLRQWLGVSRGRWEGDTLVIESTHILGKQDGGDVLPIHGGLTEHVHYYPGSGAGLRYVERYTRVSDERIEYQYTVDDPLTYVRPYTVLRPLGKGGRQLSAPRARVPRGELRHAEQPHCRPGGRGVCRPGPRGRTRGAPAAVRSALRGAGALGGVAAAVRFSGR